MQRKTTHFFQPVTSDLCFQQPPLIKKTINVVSILYYYFNFIYLKVLIPFKGDQTRSKNKRCREVCGRVGQGLERHIVRTQHVQI